MNSLETQVLELIGENTTTPDVFTDDATGMAQIRDSLNDAIQEIALLTASHKREYHMPLEGSATFYRMDWSEDCFGWVVDAWLVAQKRRLIQTDLQRLQTLNPNWMSDSGPPYEYFQVGLDIIGIWPTPTTDGDVISFTCVAIPEPYVYDTDRVKLRDDYKWAAVYFAVGEYWASRGDAKQAMYWHKRYVEKVGLQTLYPLASEKRWQYRTEKNVAGQS